MNKIKVLYLQLPLLDNDTSGQRENFPFAGAYLDHALKQSAESAFHEFHFAPGWWDDLDTPSLAREIEGIRPDILACTLYLWNIERTIHLARRLKEIRPGLRIIVGGPEIAKHHPLLEASPFDAIVLGEGEGVFPAIMERWGHV